jgi:uncharacterized membrane protein
MGIQMTNTDVQKVLAVAVPLSFVVLTATWLIMAWRMEVPKSNAELFSVLNTLLGMIGGWTAMIVGYYFNSSASSAKKDELLAGKQEAKP